MIEIIKKYEEAKVVENLTQELGIGLYFSTFDELIDSLDKLKTISTSQIEKNTAKTTAVYDEWSAESKKTFNLFEKFFTKKVEYKQTTENLQKFKQTEQELRDKQSYISQIHYKIVNALYTISAAKEDFEKLKTFADFGYTYESACKLIESMGLVPILTPDDLASFNPNADKKIESFDDLVAVHITSFTPNSAIKSSHSATKKDKMKRFVSYSTTPNENQTEDSVHFGETSYYIPYQPFRETVHFCINSPVSGGFFGASDWASMKYAVICPFSDIQSQIKAAVPQDTYIEGDYNFTNNTVVICPKNEYEQIKKKNPTARIICYDSEKQPAPVTDFSGTHQNHASAHLYAPFVISNVLGYKFINNHPHYGFIDENETKKFKELTDAAGFEYMMHSYTNDHIIEQQKWKIYKNAVMLSIIENENLDFNSIGKDFYKYYFQNIDESLIEETLSFLKTKLGADKFKKLIETMKALNKETKKISENPPDYRKYSSLNPIIEQYVNEEAFQQNV